MEICQSVWAQVKSVCVKNCPTSKDKEFLFITYACIFSVPTDNFVIVSTDMSVNKILFLNSSWTRGLKESQSSWDVITCSM
jgi:hypothetical protein